jgi:hypothetical protein
MREWSQFTENAITDFKADVSSVLNLIQASFEASNKVRTLAAGLVYLNDSKDRSGRPLLTLPATKTVQNVPEAHWQDVISYVLKGPANRFVQIL